LIEDDFAEDDARYIAPRKPRKARPEFDISTLAEPAGLEAGFQTTYKPSRFEEGWLLTSLQAFYQQSFIDDVLFHVKGGKEASVYCCAATPRTGTPLLAAKVYRPRQFRTLRNDKMYREGRPILTADGRPAKRTDHRLLRAVGKKTAFGVQVEHTSWLMYEYTTLERLHRAGGAVPKPLAASENALLMSYHGDRKRPAPTLIEVTLGRDEAQIAFAEVLRNLTLMLEHGVVHGDLSAYNILYWEGRITLIDFPQVADIQGNNNARFILQRDITRVCEYFARQGVACDPEALGAELWARYGAAADSPPLLSDD
jgi:RIO kinase 1